MDLKGGQKDGVDDHQEFLTSLDQSSESTSPKERKSVMITFVGAIGAHEFYSTEMWRAVMVELVGTAGLLFTLTTCIIACLQSNVGEPKLLIPFAIFIVAYFFLLVTFPLSGGHMNPIFTFICALKGLVTLTRALFYVLAQCLGSILGFVIIKSVLNNEAAKKYSIGGCVIDGNGEGVGVGAALMLEFSCTFLVLFLAVTVLLDRRRSQEMGLRMLCAVLAATMGMAFFVASTVTGRAGYSGVGLNPARCLGAAVVGGGELWNGHWVFWVGPFLACIFYHCFHLTLPKEFMGRMEEEQDSLELGCSCWGNGFPKQQRTKTSPN